MSFRLPIASREDVGATPRRKMTPKRALKIWEAAKGICCLCSMPIDGVKDPWFIEHPQSLGMAGPDDDAALRPAHYACKPEKDAADAAALSKARDVKKAHLGIKPAPARKIPYRKAAPVARDKLPLPPRRHIYGRSAP